MFGRKEMGAKKLFEEREKRKTKKKKGKADVTREEKKNHGN